MQVNVTEAKASVTWATADPRAERKIEVVVGNIAGVSGENNITATDAKDEATYYTVKSGDTSAPSPKPCTGMPTSTNKILKEPPDASPARTRFIGQTLRIPKA